MLKYVSKTDKGDVKKGDEFNSVFGLGAMNEARQNFTSQVVVETLASGEAITLEAVADTFGAGQDIKVIATDGTVTYVAATNGAYTATDDCKVAYKSAEFQMEQVPAIDIPTIGPKMERIALVAEPRRIAVRYDQITAFQA